jgi:aromatic ring-opening dioxygenase LigB subunit
MLVGAAVCPHPPIVVPEVASAAAPELDALRDACHTAISRLRNVNPSLIAVVGSEQPHGSAGTLAAYGLPIRVGIGPPTLPLPHTIGCWLLDRFGWTGDRAFVGPAADEIGEAADRVALLVMGDASARRSERAPGYLDERAASYDASVAAALAAGPEAVAQLDGDLAADLLVAGWPAWQLLARVARGSSWHAEVLYDDAPYGVGYIVASWLRT